MEIMRTSNICRYFNASGGCWFGNNCRFLHIPDKKPLCKFFFSSEGGCRFGDDCHFRHSNEKVDSSNENEQVSKINAHRNNNNMPSNNAQQACHATEQNETSKGEDEKNASTQNVCCSACKWTQGCEGVDAGRILREHYLDKLLKKDGQHVKSIKRLSFLPTGHVYWCKLCMISFEKSWSLFQHLADKSCPNKDGIFHENAHYEALENISGLLGGFDLGLVSLTKLQTDICELIMSNFSNLFDSFLDSTIRGESNTKMKNLRSLLKLSRKFFTENPLDNLYRGLLKHDFGMNSPLNWGFTKEDIDELWRHGIKPYDPQAQTALELIYNGYDDNSDY